MDPFDIFESVKEDVLPLAYDIARIRLKKDKIQEKMFSDHVTPMALYFIYEKYIESLLKIKNVETLMIYMRVDRLNDFDQLSLCKDGTAQDFLDSLNILRGTDHKIGDPGIEYVMIKWSFLPFFEDVFYSYSCVLPITMPVYFVGLHSLLDTQQIIVWMNDIHGLYELNDIPITVIYQKNGVRKTIYQNELLIEGTPLEAMILASYLINQLNPSKKLILYFERKQVDIISYVENHPYLLKEKLDDIIPHYTGVIHPIQQIVNFENDIFIEAFELIFVLLRQQEKDLVLYTIKDFCDNYEVEPMDISEKLENSETSKIL